MPLEELVRLRIFNKATGQVIHGKRFYGKKHAKKICQKRNGPRAAYVYSVSSLKGPARG